MWNYRHENEHFSFEIIEPAMQSQIATDGGRTSPSSSKEVRRWSTSVSGIDPKAVPARECGKAVVKYTPSQSDMQITTLLLPHELNKPR